MPSTCHPQVPESTPLGPVPSCLPGGTLRTGSRRKATVTSDQQRPPGESAVSRQVAALDAIEEIACAPAQPSLLLELCVERARALVRAGGAAVQLLECAEPGELLFAATSGMLRDQLGTLNTVQGTLCGTALRRGEVVRSADATVDPRGDRAAARVARPALHRLAPAAAAAAGDRRAAGLLRPARLLHRRGRHAAGPARPGRQQPARLRAGPGSAAGAASRRCRPAGRNTAPCWPRSSRASSSWTSTTGSPWSTRRPSASSASPGTS